MGTKPVSGIMLTMLVLSVLTLAFHVDPAMAIGTVYINANGPVTPTGAPITTSDSVTYTLTGDIIYPAYTGLVVQRSNIIIDGNGHTLQGNGTGYGLKLTNVNNVTIKNTNINSFLYGIELNHTSSSRISGNNITNSNYGVQLNSSSGNSVGGNNLATNGYGIWLSSSSRNSVSGNNITANYDYGIWLESSSNNNMNGNSITNNGVYGIRLNFSSTNNVGGNNITNNAYGIWLHSSSSNNLSENKITSNFYGVQLFSSSGNGISGNNITANDHFGIQLNSASHNSVSGNNVAKNNHGIEFYASSSNNSINGNNVTSNNAVGIYFDHSSNNTVYHNNVINNLSQSSSIQSTNIWDHGYPSGGNYWKPSLSIDLKSGPHQNETGSDGIRDTQYVISANNTDQYPLMGPFKTFDAGTWNDIPYNVDVISNSTASAFHFNPAEGTFISFNVTGSTGTTSFSRVIIPKQLLWVEPPATWMVSVSGVAVTPTTTEDANYTYLYFTYATSTKTITITGTKIITVLPTGQLSVAITANPSTIQSGQTSSVATRVTLGSNPIADATVALFSDNGGTFSATSGNTDSNGYFTITYTAPTAATQTIITITTNASKAGYLNGQNQTQITVNPGRSQQQPDSIPWMYIAGVIVVLIAVGGVVALARRRSKSQ